MHYGPFWLFMKSCTTHMKKWGNAHQKFKVGCFLCFAEEVFNSFSFLRNMFSNEFILCPGATVQVSNMTLIRLAWPFRDTFNLFLLVMQDFEEACYLLGKTGALQLTQQEVLVTERGHRTVSFLTRLLDPFLQGYQVSKTAPNCVLYITLSSRGCC